jgi:hypothetical protein
VAAFNEPGKIKTIHRRHGLERFKTCRSIGVNS